MVGGVVVGGVVRGGVVRGEVVALGARVVVESTAKRGRLGTLLTACCTVPRTRLGGGSDRRRALGRDLWDGCRRGARGGE